MNLLFVAMSDLHLGEEDSLLTNLTVGEATPCPTGPSPCMTALVNYLHGVKGRINKGKPIPYLVLVGDVIELATCSFPIAAANFRIFLFELAKRRIFDRIVYVTGNHDHALWSQIRDTQFVDSLQESSAGPNGPGLDHVTSLSVPHRSPVLESIGANLPLAAETTPLLIANPAFRLHSLSGHDFLFHHGHLLEDVYVFLTLLKERVMNDVSLDELRAKPLGTDLKQLEEENWPWLDFVWSGFVRAGRVGQTAEGVYELLSRPDGVKELRERVAEVLAGEFNIPILTESLERRAFDELLKRLMSSTGVGSKERADHKKTAFNKDVREMVRRFLNHYLSKELECEGLVPAKNRTAFVFGHTHKPFLKYLPDPKSDFGRTRIANTGGWMIESPKPNHLFKAGIVFGSNEGNLALMTYAIDSESESEATVLQSWDAEWDQLGEGEEVHALREAVSRAVAVRVPYRRKREEGIVRWVGELSR